MKTILACSIYVCAVAFARAQWEPDLRLTSDQAISRTARNRARWIAANGEAVHVVWEDRRDGQPEVYYKQSSDGGRSWGSDTRLTHAPDSSWAPALSLAASTVHIAWATKIGTGQNIFTMRSTDGGVNWQNAIPLTEDAAVNTVPCLTTQGRDVHIVWRCDGAIHYRRSTDEGVSWHDYVRLVEGVTRSYNPCVEASGSYVYALWESAREGRAQIYMRRSTNNGESWEAEVRVTNISGICNLPSVAASGETLTLVWDEGRHGGGWELYFQRSTDFGEHWLAEKRLTTSSGSVTWPSVAASGSNIHVAWQDNRSSNEEIYYKMSTDGGEHWSPDTLLVDNKITLSEHPALCISGTAVHLLWPDRRDGPNGEMYYKRNNYGNLSGTHEQAHSIMHNVEIEPNYPNPFTRSTNIVFHVRSTAFVTLSVCDIYGRKVSEFTGETLTAGTHTRVFTAEQLPRGTYVARVSAGGITTSRTILLTP